MKIVVFGILRTNYKISLHFYIHIDIDHLFVLRFYGPVNPVNSCQARSVYLTTLLLGRLSPLSG